MISSYSYARQGDAIKLKLFFCFWQKPHKLAWHHIGLHCFSIHDEITSKCRIFVFGVPPWSHDSKFGQLPSGCDDLADISEPIKPFEIFSINSKVEYSHILFICSRISCSQNSSFFPKGWECYRQNKICH